MTIQYTHKRVLVLFLKISFWIRVFKLLKYSKYLHPDAYRPGAGSGGQASQWVLPGPVCGRPQSLVAGGTRGPASAQCPRRSQQCSSPSAAAGGAHGRGAERECHPANVPTRGARAGPDCARCGTVDSDFIPADFISFLFYFFRDRRKNVEHMGWTLLGSLLPCKVCVSGQVAPPMSTPGFQHLQKLGGQVTESGGIRMRGAPGELRPRGRRAGPAGWATRRSGGRGRSGGSTKVGDCSGREAGVGGGAQSRGRGM